MTEIHNKNDPGLSPEPPENPEPARGSGRDRLLDRNTISETNESPARLTSADDDKAQVERYRDTIGVLDDRSGFQYAMAAFKALQKLEIEKREFYRKEQWESSKFRYDNMKMVQNAMKAGSVMRVVTHSLAAGLQVATGVFQGRVGTQAHNLLEAGGPTANTQAMMANTRAQTIGMVGNAASSGVNAAGEFAAGWPDRARVEHEGDIMGR